MNSIALFVNIINKAEREEEEKIKLIRERRILRSKLQDSKYKFLFNFKFGIEQTSPKNLDDLNSQNNLNPFLDSLHQVKTSLSEKIGDNSVRGLGNIEEIKKKTKADILNALGDILKLIENVDASESKSGEGTIDSDLEAMVTKVLKEVESRKILDQSQRELPKIQHKEPSYKKELEEKDKKIAMKQEELDELRKQLENTQQNESKGKADYRELQEKFNSKSNEFEKLEKKLKSSSQMNTAQQAKNDELEAMIGKLDAELKAALKDVDKRVRVEHTVTDQANKQADELRRLKDELTNTKKEREDLEKELHSLRKVLTNTEKEREDLEKELCSLRKVLTNTEKEREDLEKELYCLRKDTEEQGELNSQVILYKDKAKHAEVEIHNLGQNIKELESKLENVQSDATVARAVHEEVCRLQKSDAEKSEKIKLLEMELTKAHFQNQKLEEKIVMDRKLLKVRSNLIESLQSKENTQKVHLKDLFAEVGERNNDIQMLKSELLMKTEEFQNLFSTLGTKQLELTRQEHMIKLLQESNERAQTLRVKQEAKIGRLEEEVAHLKQTVAVYQDAVLPNNELRKNLLMTEVSRDNGINETLDYYVDERRRKRHIDINVKKYEK